ncbi:hypothetical protein [Vibrio mexicanus]|uniref:hypothetical protein n=1 Tax=Vibrio mexicanus TaxID=1004326 RepID=UPI00063BF931|nr:hypothetical protein [Vibrio mexicanus]
MKRRFWGMFTTKAQPFSKWWQDFRSEVIVIPMKDPLDPIVSVDDKVLTVRTGYHTRRNTIVIPLMLLFTFMPLYMFYDFLPNLSSNQEYAHRMLASIEKEKASNQLRYGAEETEKYARALLDENGEVTWATYLRAKEVEGRLGRFFEV